MISKNNPVVVTGASGFLGKFVLRELSNRGYENIVGTYANYKNKKAYPAIPNVTWDHLDLLVPAYSDKTVNDVHNFLQKHNPVATIHLAATVGGIGANADNPGRFMYENLAMGMNLIEALRMNRSTTKSKFVMVGTVCSYPKFAPVPFLEEDLWNGYPEETNAPYGIAKKTLMELVIAYNKQYGFNGVNLLPVNLYGPEDNFDLESSHVIPALIRKFETARINNDESVSLWGTGSASREFLYVKDAARGIVNAMEEHNDPQPINLGTCNEITIAKLANKIKNVVGYTGQIVYDPTKPNGQPRRCLDTNKAKEKFDWWSTTDFEFGLRETLQWWREQQ